MKHILLGAIMLLAVGSSAAYADETKVNKKVVEKFKATFTRAEAATWDRVGDLYKVTFNQDNQRITTFYSLDGELVSTTRFIKIEEAPILVQKSIEDRWAQNYAITTTLIEMTKDNETYYYLSANDNKREYVVKIYSNGDAYVEKSKKLKKS